MIHKINNISDFNIEYEFHHLIFHNVGDFFFDVLESIQSIPIVSKNSIQVNLYVKTNN